MKSFLNGVFQENVLGLLYLKLKDVVGENMFDESGSG